MANADIKSQGPADLTENLHQHGPVMAHYSALPDLRSLQPLLWGFSAISVCVLHASEHNPN